MDFASPLYGPIGQGPFLPQASDGSFWSDVLHHRSLLDPRSITGLQAFYDVSDTSSMVIDGSNRVSLIADKSGRSAVNCFASQVVAGNSMTSPDKSVTGNQVITFDVGMESYRPAADRVLIGKLSGNNGLEVLVLTTGVVRLRVGDGSSVTNVDSTAALANNNLARTTVAITWTDGVGAAFTQDGAALGTAVAAAVTMTNAAVAITIGLMLGRIYRVQVGSVYDCNPALAAKLASSFVSGGDTWTINTTGDLGARISGERDLYQGTVSKQPVWSLDGNGRPRLTLDGSDDYMRAPAFSLSQPETVYFVGSQVGWVLNRRLWDGGLVNRMGALQSSTSPQFAINAGSLAATNSNFAVGTNAVLTCIYATNAYRTRVNRLTPVTAVATANDANGFTLGADGNPTAGNFGNITTNEVAIYSAAHPTALQDALVRSFGAKWGIPV
jgi:hypothetical protein